MQLPSAASARPTGLLLDAKLPDNLAARVADRAMNELLEARRELARQHVEVLQDPNDSRELRALSAVFDLERNTKPARGHGYRVDALGTDLRDNVPLRLLDEDGVEAVGTADQEGTCLHRVDDTPRNLIIVSSGAAKACPGSSHVRQRQREHHGATSVHRS